MQSLKNAPKSVQLCALSLNTDQTKKAGLQHLQRLAWSCATSFRFKIFESKLLKLHFYITLLYYLMYYIYYTKAKEVEKIYFDLHGQKRGMAKEK